MALSHEHYLGMQMPTPSEVQTPVATPEITLKQGEPVSLGKLRLDNVGTPDFAALAERSRLTSDILPVEELHGFAAYHKAGGVFSEGLYGAIMDGVIELQEPGVREKSNFSTGTKFQIKGFEDSHNKPFLRTVLPPEEQIFLTEAQKDAYRLVREGHIFVSPENIHDPYFPDSSLFAEILKMPSLESYSLSKQEQSEALPAAA